MVRTPTNTARKSEFQATPQRWPPDRQADDGDDEADRADDELVAADRAARGKAGGEQEEERGADEYRAPAHAELPDV